MPIQPLLNDSGRSRCGRCGRQETSQEPTVYWRIPGGATACYQHLDLISYRLRILLRVARQRHRHLSHDR